MTDNDYIQEFKDSLTSHINYVQEAGEKIGVKRELLQIHDDSKWTAFEFPAYAKHFKGGGDPIGFCYAWLHHIHHNPHHWQYWMFPDGYSYSKDHPIEVNEAGVLEMPEMYILEMVADWMGASKAYTGDWDMTDWLAKNLSTVRIHSKSKLILVEILDGLGYRDVL